MISELLYYIKLTVMKRKDASFIFMVMINDKETIIIASLRIVKPISKKHTMCAFFIMTHLCFSLLPVFAQSPRFFGSQNNSAVPVAPVGSAPVSVPAVPQTSGSATESSPIGGIQLYDPVMDNHLRAPVSGEEIGLFGKPINEVESYMRFLGAKNHSYAFGKYSRMVLSVYLVTLYFDRERKLGGFAVEPRPPYSVIGPDARKYFLEVFVGNNDLSRFESIFASDRLELRYAQ